MIVEDVPQANLRATQHPTGHAYYLGRHCTRL